MASTGATAVVHRPLASALEQPGAHSFRLVPEPHRSGPPAIAVLHDGTRHIGYLAPEVTATLLDVLERLGSHARRLWVHGEISGGEVRLQLPSLEQIKLWMG